MKRIFRTSAALLAAALLVPAGLTACSSDTSAEPSGAEASTLAATDDEASVEGTEGTDEDAADDATSSSDHLRIGIFMNRPGVGWMNEDGTPSGFDVDVAAYVAWKLGYPPSEVEWIETNPSDRVPFLQDGTVDLVVATVAISEKLREDIDFAGPYLIAAEDMVVQADNVSITGVATFPGHKICAQLNSNVEKRLIEMFGNQLDIVHRDSVSDCTEAVIAGEADAAASNDLTLAGIAAADEFFGKVRLLGSKFQTERLGIAIPKGQTEMCEAINGALNEMIADGSWQRFVDRHTAGTGYKPKEYEYPPVIDSCQ
ncbi:MAG: transporter substrate-binding domain-containing protein [Cellulomonadaceae bacterium]|jgi:glutamate transport system substrate-binding protein|nr:transporter substrate-binding domain-containing protein [Cellulomonadaceae bacterium]